MSNDFRQQKARRPALWLYDALLFLVLLAGILLRLAGSNWGEYQYLHPDERFLIWVGSDIAPVENVGQYFDTANSSLNPHNRGHGFYVYGTLPMFLARYVVEWVYGHSGFQEMTNVGRALSAAADLLAVYLVYLVGESVYHKRVGLLAAAFSAFAVLQIQQAHFFTMDTFINLFTLLAIYFAVRVAGKRWKMEHPAVETEAAAKGQPLLTFVRRPFFLLSIGFGVALGCAVASKLNAAPVAIMLPVAFGLLLWKVPAEERPRRMLQSLSYLTLAALVSLLVFRLAQPYAFSGPGFFDLRPNPRWVQNILDQRNQAAGDVDFPPALQWARRPIWFSFQNLTIWGLGLPLGILAWAGVLWTGWRMLHGEWQRHFLLWAWTALYFTWQSLQFNPTMRYQLPIYPTLAIFAAWAVFELYERGKQAASLKWLRPASVALGSGVLLLTLAYALGFTGIYLRPITRVEASRWIYQNVPGPINLRIQTADGLFNQPLPYPYGSTIQAGSPYVMTFTPKRSGNLEEVYLAHITEKAINQEMPLMVSFSTQANGSEPLVVQKATISRVPGDNVTGKEFLLWLNQPVYLEKDRIYFLSFSVPENGQSLDVCGSIVLVIQTPLDIFTQKLLPGSNCVIQSGAPYVLPLTALESGTVGQIYFEQARNTESADSVRPTLRLRIHPLGEEGAMREAELNADFAPGANGIGPGYTLTLNAPLNLEANKTYQLSLSLETPGKAVALQGAGLANEGDWDDGLPLRLDGYDGFGGIYPQDMEFQMYWDDNPEKLERFLRIYDQAEYIVISSNRQWGVLPRLPERFPMTSLHYRYLLGCPENRSIEWCYRVAQPGMFQGKLGFELVAVFQSDPSLGPLRLNDQFAEEAFTVYDHPKVLIFRKTEAYDPYRVRILFDTVDFDQVIHVTPKKAPSYPLTLTLPTERLAEQRAGGTWSELFNPEALHNRVQPVGVILWYLSVTLLGLVTYPALRLALPALADRGFPLARLAGMLVFSYLAWLAGSLRLPVTRLLLGLVLLGMVVLGGYLAYRQRRELLQEWRERRKYFLLVEGWALALFVFFLLVRLGNPDLWHPYHGGERPMDFSYLNAVLKSTTFPPYDPWYAGGYMNYYYYGFVYVGMLVKLLGIVPSFAYNLILPSLFSMVGIGAFSIAYNLRSAQGFRFSASRLMTGFAGSAAMVLLGNLGTVRMILRGYAQLGTPGGLTDATPLFAKILGFFRGLVMVALEGESLPYGLGDWYWIPSRTIAAPGEVEPITEFPLFTFLYSDLHAHMIALPLALLALAWALAVVMGKAKWPSPLAGALGFVLGGLAIGALYPTNLSDIYTYLPLGLTALGYGVWRYANTESTPWLISLSPSGRKVVFLGVAAILMLILTLLAFGLFQPYRAWYGQPYSQLGIWRGTRTPLDDYLVHWGLFLFVIVSWMVWETLDWMAHTPLSALRKVNWHAVTALLTLLLSFTLLLAIRAKGIDNSPILNKLPFGRGIETAWLILPLAAWAGLLLLRPGLADEKRVVLFWFGTGLLITLMVEIVVVVGDIGRMNTVFKFYLQTWLLFGLSAAAAFGWLLGAQRRWKFGWRVSWQSVFVLLVCSAALFLFLGGMAKIKNRYHAAYPELSPAPHTLDGMAYMPYAKYYETNTAGDNGAWMDLGQDYRAILWLLKNVKGSPVILEAPNNGRQYHWYTRYTIYTGLPGVVGWEWHQQQQRALNPSDWVNRRSREMEQFYLTLDTGYASSFLRKYDVRYIIVGQLERISYPPLSLQKFDDFNGVLWQEVYRDRDTVIYEVIK